MGCVRGRGSLVAIGIFLATCVGASCSTSDDPDGSEGGSGGDDLGSAGETQGGAGTGSGPPEGGGAGTAARDAAGADSGGAGAGGADAGAPSIGGAGAGHGGTGGASECADIVGSGGQSTVTLSASAVATSCTCDGVYSYCEIDVDTFCVEGLSCPMTLDAVRRDFASICSTDNDVVLYEECSDGNVKITWGSRTFAFDGGSGELVYGAATGVVPEALREGTCVPEVSELEDADMFADRLPSGTMLSRECASCYARDFSGEACRIDSLGRIALPR